MANSLGRDIKIGEKVVLKANTMRSEYQDISWRTVIVCGEDFGNYAFTSGKLLMVKFKDGEVGSVSGYDISPQETAELQQQLAS